jgi:pilus assembly protein CpaB
MNKRFVAVLIFAFVVATGASLMLYRLMASRPTLAKTAPTTVKLALAGRDLEMGTVLREEDITLEDWPGTVPPGAATRIQDLVGRGVITKIFAKEHILETRLAPKGAGGGFAAIIPKGMRAVAVPVNEVVGVAGFVIPGMHVDVLISGAPPENPPALGTLTKTLLQNIEVLSAGQDFKKDAEGKPVMVQVVNLLVTPEQAEKLSLASHQTTIQLVLRNPLDRDTAQTPGTALAHLFSGVAGNRAGADAAPRPRSIQPVVLARQVAPPPKEVAPPPKKEPPFVMEIFSGAKRAEAKFDANQEAK